MKKLTAVLVAMYIAAAMIPSPVAAQELSAMGIWTGLGVATPSLSAAHEREMFVVGVQYRHVIARPSFVTISYAPSVIPAVVLARPEAPPQQGVVTCQFCVAGTGVGVPALGRAVRSLGFGLVPAELELTFGDDADLAITWGGGLGFLWLGDSRHSVSARPFNIMSTARFGLRADTGLLGAIDLGARVQHLSHGGTPEHPGVSVLVWSVGWSMW
jgi:hypothetical protein